MTFVRGGTAKRRSAPLLFVGTRSATIDLMLHTGDMKPVTHEDLAIALVELTPYPFSSRPIQPGDYRATLRVTR